MMIPKLHAIASLALLAGLGALTGCENPADNVPEARVSEVAPATTPEASATPDVAATPAADVAPVMEATPAAVETTPTALLTPPQVLVLAPTSRIDWVGSKITGKHDGGFTTFTGQITYVPGDPAASGVSVTINTRSLWSDTPKLTGHLQSPDFFDVEAFPSAEFVSTSIVKTDAGYDVTGNLTLKGTTKTITFPATITEGPDGITAKAEFFIKRFDFGIVYPGKPDDLIRDEVVIKLDLTTQPAGS